MSDLVALANGIYGEGASTDYDTMLMIGSTVMNRLNAKRANEFGGTIPDVLQKGYYAVSNPNVPYKQAESGVFPDKASEDKYKRAYAIASGLLRGTIKPTEGQFYFTDSEIKKLKKRGKKAFNFKAVKKVGKVGDYQVFSY